MRVKRSTMVVILLSESQLVSGSPHVDLRIPSRQSHQSLVSLLRRAAESREVPAEFPGLVDEGQRLLNFVGPLLAGREVVLASPLGTLLDVMQARMADGIDGIRIDELGRVQLPRPECRRVPYTADVSAHAFLTCFCYARNMGAVHSKSQPVRLTNCAVSHTPGEACGEDRRKRASRRCRNPA
jgi:hypothetical protein